MEKRLAQMAKTDQIMRDHRPKSWRQARRQLAGYGDNIRPILLDYWNTHRWLPGDPSYLLGMLHSYDIGRLQTYATFKAALGEPVEPIKPLSMVERVQESRNRTPQIERYLEMLGSGVTDLPFPGVDAVLRPLAEHHLIRHFDNPVGTPCSHYVDDVDQNAQQKRRERHEEQKNRRRIYQALNLLSIARTTIWSAIAVRKHPPETSPRSR